MCNVLCSTENSSIDIKKNLPKRSRRALNTEIMLGLYLVETEKERKGHIGFKKLYSVPVLWYPSERDKEQDEEREGKFIQFTSL